MRTSKELVQFRIGLMGSLLVTAIAVIIQLLGIELLDQFLVAAVNLFAVAIPLISLDAYLLISEFLVGRQVRSTARRLFRFVAVVLFFAALVCLFFHFSAIAGVLFSGMILVSILLYILLYRAWLIEAKE